MEENVESDKDCRKSLLALRSADEMCLLPSISPDCHRTNTMLNESRSAMSRSTDEVDDAETYAEGDYADFRLCRR